MLKFMYSHQNSQKKRKKCVTKKLLKGISDDDQWQTCVAVTI